MRTPTVLARVGQGTPGAQCAGAVHREHGGDVGGKDKDRCDTGDGGDAGWMPSFLEARRPRNRDQEG